MIHKIIYFIILTVILSCGKSTSNSQANTSSEYFNMGLFIDSLITHADTIRSVTKTVRLNDQSETKKITSYNIKNDLLEFAKKNIAQSKFIGKYNIIPSTHTPHLTTYIANDPDLQIRSFGILRDDGGQVKVIDIVEHKSTSLIKQFMLHSYRADKGYFRQACDTMTVVGVTCKGYEVEF